MILLPGLIDPHVHLRDPGQKQKEDFTTGTSAALAGGYTTIIDMPNNTTPITTAQLLLEKRIAAKAKIVCDVGFHFGSLGTNFEEFEKLFPSHPGKRNASRMTVLGLKIYLNITTGNYIVDEKVFEKICEAWPVNTPIVVHAEENVLESILQIAKSNNQNIHIAHVSTKKELSIIMHAKEKGYSVTCGITPHHLFLCHPGVAATTIGSQKSEILSLRSRMTNPFFAMKPNLKSKSDVGFLWNNLSHIDVIESDHAPHTIEEKESDPPPFGVPGLETTLPLLLTAMSEGRITLEEINRLCSDNPAKIFNIKTDPQTYVEIDEQAEWVINNEDLFTKCKWSPFAGWEMKGKVKSVTIRGTKVFEDGKILVDPGFGEIIP